MRLLIAGGSNPRRCATADAAAPARETADPVALILRDAVAAQVRVHRSALEGMDRHTLGRIAAWLEEQTLAPSVRVTRVRIRRPGD